MVVVTNTVRMVLAILSQTQGHMTKVVVTNVAILSQTCVA